MPRNNNPRKELPETPQPSPGIPGQPFDPVPLLSRIEGLENGQKLLTDTIKFVKDTNSVVLLVLALGFVALLVSIISGVIQATMANSTTQIEVIKSNNDLKNAINNLIISYPQPTKVPTPTVILSQ